MRIKARTRRCRKQCAGECREGTIRVNAATNTIELDVRGLEPPEPLVRVISSLETLPPGASLLLKIDCRPLPLYRILDRDGYVYEERPGTESLLEITIRARDKA